MLIPDPTEEIRAIRHKLAAMFDNDVQRIGADILRQQRESGRTYITLPKREPSLARAVPGEAMAEKRRSVPPEKVARQ